MERGLIVVMAVSTATSGGLTGAVLGPVELRFGDVILDVGGYRQRRLLAVLLSRADAVVEVQSLVEFVWDDAERPAGAVEAVRTYVSRLRRAIGSTGLRPESIVHTRAPGYQFAVGEGARVDAHVFVERVGEARLRAEGGDARGACAAYDDALSLWRGGAFQEFADLGWAESEATRLEELRLVAVEERASAMIACGAYGEVIADLEPLIGANPLRGRPVELMMTALSRSDRQAEALRVAAGHRRELADVGLEPPPAVVRLEDQVARLDAELFPPRPTAGRVPRPTTSFVGRSDDVRALADRLSSSRLITVTGAGGIGKTRLAAEAAVTAGAEFAGGVWYAPLGNVDRDDLVAPTLLGSLDVAGWSGDPVDALVRRLGGDSALLVVDNCEHLVDSVADVLRTLLDSTSATFLCTSREPIGIDGESIHALDHLPDADASALFIDRARAAGLEADPSSGAVQTICARLDGLPLAIELAAARAPGLGVDELARLIGSHLELLAGRRRRIERHRTIIETINWSYRLLEPGEQALFRRLAPFANGFTLDAASVVAAADGATPSDVVSGIVSLAEKSMIVVQDGVAGTRHRLLEPMRQFARDRLVEAGEAEPVDRRFVRWTRERWDEIARELEGPAEAAAVPHAMDEWDNLVAAADTAMHLDDLSSAFALIASTRTFAQYRGRYEVASWADALLGRPRAEQVVGFEEAAALVAIGQCIRGEWDRAHDLAVRARRAAIDAGRRPPWRGVLAEAVIESNGRHDMDAARPLYRSLLGADLSPGDAAVQRANLSGLTSLDDDDRQPLAHPERPARREPDRAVERDARLRPGPARPVRPDEGRRTDRVRLDRRGQSHDAGRLLDRDAPLVARRVPVQLIVRVEREQPPPDGVRDPVCHAFVPQDLGVPDPDGQLPVVAPRRVRVPLIALVGHGLHVDAELEAGPGPPVPVRDVAEDAAVLLAREIGDDCLDDVEGPVLVDGDLDIEGVDVPIEPVGACRGNEEKDCRDDPDQRPHRHPPVLALGTLRSLGASSSKNSRALRPDTPATSDDGNCATSVLRSRTTAL